MRAAYSNMKTKLITLGLAAVMAALIVGCTTSSGVVAAGPDTYKISRTEWGLRSSGFVKAAAIKEANAYCKERGKAIMVIKTVESDSEDGSKPAAEVYFKCLATNDPALKEPPPIEEIVQ
jgi:hypothetical protein